MLLFYKDNPRFCFNNGLNGFLYGTCRELPMLNQQINLLLVCILWGISMPLRAQMPDSLKVKTGKDTMFIRTLYFPNEVRATIGTKASSVIYGSQNESANISENYFNNVSDMIGVGLTYKFIDFDLSFTLPKTRFMDEGIQNLQQFRLSGSYYGDRWTIQGAWRNSTGLVATDAGGEFKSTPDLHMVTLSAQFIYNFNFRKYSFKSANYQNELQRKSAGSFLVRIEPYYRNLGVSTLVPPDRSSMAIYGQQAGLYYVHSPGINVLPGYGYNIAIREGRYFISPIVMGGGGVAISRYGGTEEHVVFNTEWVFSASLSAGYNGRRMYAAFRSFYETHHFNLNPTYFTTADIRIGITVAYRFVDVEKLIPRL